MKKIKKIALAILACLCVGLGACAFVACNGNDDGSSGASSGVESSGAESTGDEGEEHVHSFVEKVAKKKYLKEDATCLTKAEYYQSCACGKASETDVFAYGELGAHDVENDECTVCHKQASVDLRFTLSGDGTYYIVSGMGDCEDTNVLIPSAHQDLAVKEIGAGAFYGCESLTHVTINGEIETIGEGAFGACQALTDVVICDGVKTVGERAFEYCHNLVTLTVGETVSKIGEGAFFGCYKLVEVYNRSALNISAGSSSYGFAGYYALNVCTHAYASKVAVDENGYVIYFGKAEKKLLGYTGTKTNLVLPDGVTEIYPYAFIGCENLVSVEICYSVAYIGESAFYKCKNLTSVNIGLGVTGIGKTAFAWCENLSEIALSDSVAYIGESAFYECGNLSNVTIGGGMETLGDGAFEYCKNLTSVTFEGTKAQWNDIEKGYGWTYGVPATKVVCVDGDVAL